MTFGDRVKEARRRARLSQAALAEKADMSLPGVAKIEQGGAVDPHWSTLSRLAEVLDVSPLWLIGEVSAETPAPKAPAPRKSGPQARGKALLEAPGVQDWLRERGGDLLLMADDKFAKFLEETVRTSFDVSALMEQLRKERSAIRVALHGTTHGMPEALMPAGAEGATRHERGVDAIGRRQDLEAWARYEEFRRSIALVNRLEHLIYVEAKDLVEGLQVPAITTESTKP